MRVPVGVLLEKLGVRAEHRGRRWWAEDCPLPTHGQPNAAHRWQNFFVRDETGERPGQFHCFSCKGGGGVVDLVVAMRGGDRAGARAWLRSVAEQAPELGGGVRVRFERVEVRDHMRMPEGVEQVPMGRWNGVAYAYARSRGIEPWQVARWQIGVATTGRLEGRIIFPIYSAAGLLLDYAARTYVGEAKRYLNASEQEGPVRGAMFGEQFWKPGFPVAIVFEGAINGLAVERALPDGGVGLAGLSGSLVCHRRLLKLSSFGRLVLVTDPDRAGEEANAQIWHGLRGADRRIARASLPVGMDAAELPREALRAELLRCLREVGI